MPGLRHTASHRLAAVAGALLVVAAVVVLADLSLALELAPGVLLLGLAVAGWMPGEARLVRAMRRRRGPRPTRRPVLLHVPRAAPAALRGRIGASSVALRGPPRALPA